MIYDEYLTTAELQRWILEIDVLWNSINRDLALSQPELLEQVRESALIESYFPLYTTNLIRACWDQIDLTSVFSVQLYESYKHFYALNRYLEIVGYRPLADGDLIEVRARNVAQRVEDPIRELARYMISEHFAAYFFLRLSRQAKEPVLQQITACIAKDEFRHTQFAYDLLEPRIRNNEETRLHVLEAGVNFKHVGADVVPNVPVALKNDIQAILTLDKKMHRLCGISISEYSQKGIHAGYGP
jgi:hypothetical protein